MKKIFLLIFIFFFILLIPKQIKAQPPGRECSTNLMLVLDVSSSMGDDCSPSQDAAKDFISKFMEKPELQNWAGVVHFGYKYTYWPTKYWTKLSQELTSDKNAVSSTISQSCVDNTPTESGIVMATEELLEEGKKPESAGVPKVMIIFTDGAPNACASSDCYCRTAGDGKCKTNDECANANCDYDPDGPGPNTPNAKDDAINAADIAKTNGIRVFVIGYGSATKSTEFRNFNRALASDNCLTSPFKPDCYWEALKPGQLGQIYDAIFLEIADRDGDGFIDKKCGGNDWDDTKSCVNPTSTEAVKFGTDIDPARWCNSSSSVATIFKLSGPECKTDPTKCCQPDGTNCRADYVCEFKRFIYKCDSTYAGICILGCEDTLDNDQSGQGDLGDEKCPELLAAGLVPCGRRADDPKTPEFENCPCRLCHFLILGDRIVKFALFRIVASLAVLMLVIGGVMFLTAGGSPEQISSARKLMTNVAIGILIIFAAWLIVNTFLMLVGVANWTGLRTGWWQIKCPVPNLCDFRVCTIDGVDNPCFLSNESCP